MSRKSRKRQVYTIACSHLDTSWLWTLETSIKEYIPNTLFRNFELFEKYPEYTFGFEGSYRYELMEEYYPEAFETLKSYVERGRWVPVGSSYENGDVNTPSPEALFRNILYGNSYFENKFGKRSNDIFLPDCFGFGYALPSIAAHANLKGFSTGKLAWGSAYGAPFDLGKWYGVDGRYVYANIKPGSYSRSLSKIRRNKTITPKLAENEQFNLPFTAAFHGTGDRGGAPAESSVETVFNEAAENPKNRTEVFSVSSTQLFEIMDKQLTDEQKSMLPSWDNELLLTDHGVGSYTSRSVGKRWNKNCERLADAAERSAVAASWLGCGEYPAAALDEAWKRTIAHQFHDDITGTSFQVCYKRNWNDYILAQNRFAEEYTSAAGSIASLMDTSFVKGVAVIVNNPVQCEGERRQVVTARVNPGAGVKCVRVIGSDGKEVPSQITGRNQDGIEVAFSASVPSVGFAVYDVRVSDKPYVDVSALAVTSQSIENSKLRLLLNANGDICEIFDKRLGKNVLSAPVSLAVFDYKGSKSWPSWELTYPELCVPPREYAANASIKILEFGPARASLEVTRTAGKSRFRQIISLDADGDVINVFNEVDWRSTSSLLKAVFPLASSNKKATYDLGLGVIERENSNEKLYEVPAQKWADITHEDGSFGVSVFSDSRAGWDKPDDNTLRLTAVHTPYYNYRWECSQHLLDLGLNRFSFGIMSHAGSWKSATQQSAAFFDQPMRTFVTGTHAGKLGKKYSFAHISDNDVIIRAIKKELNGDRVVVRFNEGCGAPRKGVRFSIGNGIESAVEMYASEEYRGEASVDNGELVFDIGAYEPKTFALRLKKASVKTAPVRISEIKLPCNITAITDNASREYGELQSCLSVPRELVPDVIRSGNAAFKVCPDESANALACCGQTLTLPEGTGRVYLLATSTDGDKTVDFKVGDETVNLHVSDCFEAVGAWDIIGLGETGYIKKDVLGFCATHTHSRSEDIVAKQFYFFKYALDIPAGVSQITVPVDESIIILAAAAVPDMPEFSAACEMYDSLEKRPFDYRISRDEYLKALPSKAEVLMSSKVNRDKSLTIDILSASGTFQIADAFALIRNWWN
ncbi:MAG: hypothetical protein GX051_04130 [Clostridiales bacterium]|nr:hypothetical protein [Clostridiales bacterium]